MNNLTVSASPHITKVGNSTRRIMLDVIIALMPCVIAAVFFFGYHVIINVVVCVGACFGSELLYTLIIKKKFSKAEAKKSSALDLSSVVTGIILALNLPSKIRVDKWNFNFYDGVATGVNNIVFSFDTIIICVIGSIFAIMLVKMLFGGIGKNFANPAATARVFISIAFSLAAVSTIGLGLSATTGATWLSGNKGTSNQAMFLQMFLGNKSSAAVGETSVLAILIGFVYLSIRKVIDPRLPLIVIGSAAVFAFVFDGLIGGLTGAKLVNNMYAHIMSGGLMFGAVFMATDYSTSPNTFVGKAIFGVGIGLITMLIRVFTPMPEGVSYAILLMNLVVPLIDKYIIPRPFGFIKPEKIKKNKDSSTNKEKNDKTEKITTEAAK